MLKTIASTEQYSGQRLTCEVMAFLPKSGLEMFQWQKILQRERLNNGFFQYLR